MSIKVFIADNHPVVRDGIKYIIDKKGEDIKIIGEASNGNEVLEFARKNLVDIYILEVSMPILNGIETTHSLIKMDEKNRIIILSTHDSRTIVERALKSGARGYILKESATEEIIHAIHEVYMGRFFLSPAISKFVVDGFLGNLNNSSRHKRTSDLTKKEREILQLIGEGFTDKEISKKFNLSLYTVHVHRKNIMRKLDIHKQAGLIRYAIKEGISKL